MDLNKKKLVLSGLLLLGLPLAFGPAVYAAKPVDLSHQPVSILQPLMASPAAMIATGAVQMEETSRSIGPNKTLHVRVQQTYSGHKVWGGDSIIHIPNGTKTAKSLTDVYAAAKNTNSSMDGTLYQDLNADLSSTPAAMLTAEQGQKALQLAIENYQHKVGGKSDIKDQESKLIVYMDNDNKARWTFLVKFYVEPARSGDMPAKPALIMDATTLQVYQEWNEIKTISSEVGTKEEVSGGGFGGNVKMGKVSYDGLADHLSKLVIQRDGDSNLCFLQDADVTVKNFKGGKVMTFPCKNKDADHNDLYWDGEMDAVNSGYSPSNDAMFGGLVIKDMYEKWYGMPVLTENGKPMMLNMVVHDPIDNAFWDGRQMTFGDGVSMFYPLTSLGVAAHEISHGFTEQHAGLAYYGQSGGMNESFSDMAAQAAEVYAYGKNSWQIGPEIFKEEGRALRYMDQPSKDCNGKKPGNWCSIDNVSQYTSNLDVHFSSGIYNRAFYLAGSAPFWTPKMAFDVMLHANMNYWTSNTNFEKGACGVLKAAADLGLSPVAYKKAFKKVGVNTSKC